MAHSNLRFTSGLFGTQTTSATPPVGGWLRFVPRVWAVRGAIGAFATALTLLGLVWFNHPVSAETVVGVSSSASMTVSAADWTPTPQAGISRPAVDRDRSLTIDQFRALQAFPEDQRELFACIARAESGFDPASVIVDVDGLPRAGAWHVGATWWGEVGPTLVEQATQVALIASEHGSRPWTTSEACQ